MESMAKLMAFVFQTLIAVNTGFVVFLLIVESCRFRAFDLVFVFYD